MVRVNKNTISQLLFGINFYPIVFIVQLFFLINYTYWFGDTLNPFTILVYIIMPPSLMAIMFFMGKIKLNKKPFSRTPLGKGTVYLLIGLMVTWAIVLAIVFAFDIKVGIISAQYAMPIMMFQLLLVAPSEEMTFRELIPRIFGNLRWYWRMGFSQLMFSGFHIATYGAKVELLLFAFIFGCLLLVLVDKYGLPLGIGIHFAYNCVMLGILSGGVVV
jgi:membrane protease YdiL (CAAX protease family)